MLTLKELNELGFLVLFRRQMPTYAKSTGNAQFLSQAGGQAGGKAVVPMLSGRYTEPMIAALTKARAIFFDTPRFQVFPDFPSVLFIPSIFESYFSEKRAEAEQLVAAALEKFLQQLPEGVVDAVTRFGGDDNARNFVYRYFERKQHTISVRFQVFRLREDSDCDETVQEFQRNVVATFRMLLRETLASMRDSFSILRDDNGTILRRSRINDSMPGKITTLCDTIRRLDTRILPDLVVKKYAAEIESMLASMRNPLGALNALKKNDDLRDELSLICSSLLEEFEEAISPTEEE